MGAKGGNKKGPNTTTPRRGPMTLRQQAALEKQGNAKIINVSSETMLKLDHLKSITSWAATEARIPQLAAFYGQRYAATAEAAGVPPDPSLFYCQRCESILEPGTNCTVRVEPNKARRRRKRLNPNNPLPPQNYIVYACKVCSHRNAMRGTPKGYLKEMCSSKANDQLTSISKPSSETDIIFSNSVDANVAANIDLPIVNGDSGEGEPNRPLTTPLPGESEPNKPLTTTPSPGTALTLLESKKWRSRSGAKKTAKRGASLSEANGENTVAASSKRRRKSGMSLKEIAERDNREHDVGLKFDNISIPFNL